MKVKYSFQKDVFDNFMLVIKRPAEHPQKDFNNV